MLMYRRCKYRKLNGCRQMFRKFSFVCWCFWCSTLGVRVQSMIFLKTLKNEITIDHPGEKYTNHNRKYLTFVSSQFFLVDSSYWHKSTFQQVLERWLFEVHSVLLFFTNELTNFVMYSQTIILRYPWYSFFFCLASIPDTNQPFVRGGYRKSIGLIISKESSSLLHLPPRGGDDAEVTQTKFKVWSVILCSWSEVFEKMMSEAFRENTTKEVGGWEWRLLGSDKLDISY